MGVLVRYGTRAAFGTAILLLTASTGCSGGTESTAAPTPTSAATSSASASASTAAPSPSPPDLAEVVNRTRNALMANEAGRADAPGDQGLMLVEARPAGAAFTWETRDRRLCWASHNGLGFSERACTTAPLAVEPARGLDSIATLFTDGWVRLFGADHQEVTSATCAGAPLAVRRIGTVADGARTLYSVRFPDHTKGSIALSLRHDGTTSEAALPLGDLGDHTCDRTN